MPIEWVGRDQRFGEKCDSGHIDADLIGEVDPSRWRRATCQTSSRFTMASAAHEPGIFAINELPDLAERIQVGLLNVLEERDVQIRGYKIAYLSIFSWSPRHRCYRRAHITR